jgi:hypothetical protein
MAIVTASIVPLPFTPESCIKDLSPGFDGDLADIGNGIPIIHTEIGNDLVDL